MNTLTKMIVRSQMSNILFTFRGFQVNIIFKEGISFGLTVSDIIIFKEGISFGLAVSDIMNIQRRHILWSRRFRYYEYSKKAYPLVSPSRILWIFKEGISFGLAVSDIIIFKEGISYGFAVSDSMNITNVLGIS